VRSRVAGNNLPDIALFPQPGVMMDIAKSGKLRDLTGIIDVNAIKGTLVPGELDAGTSPDGNVYGAPMSMNVKSLVWYPKKAFEEAGYEIPESQEELLALTEQIKADGTPPWCIGIESGPATGWPATDWLEDFMVRENGPDVYADWVAHKIPFNDPKVAASLAKVGSFLKNPKYVNGGIGDVKTIASTDFKDGGLPISKGTCFMHRQASFYANFWPAGSDISENGDYFAFYLPQTNDKYGKPVLIGGTFLGAFADKPEVKALQYYVASKAFSDAYVANGPNVTANNKVDSTLIKLPFSKLSYGILVDPDAKPVFDGSDLMPGEIGSGALWKELTAWIAQDQSDQVTLDNVEAAWPAS